MTNKSYYVPSTVTTTVYLKYKFYTLLLKYGTRPSKPFSCTGKVVYYSLTPREKDSLL